MSVDPQEQERLLNEKFTKLRATIDAFAETSYGSDLDGDLSRQRAEAIDAYAGKNIDPAPEGRSQVVDWTVFETIQWILPSLTRIFASGDKVVEFEPFGPEDEEAAEQESEYLNYLVTKKNDWFLTCLTWFQDALLTKNAYCMAFIEEKLATEIESYEGKTAEQVALILDDDVEIVGQNAYFDEKSDPEPVLDEFGQLQIDPLSGEPIVQLRQLFDVEVRRTQPSQQLRFEVLPSDHCKVDQNCRDYTLEKCNYFEYWDDETTRSELRAMGYQVDETTTTNTEPETEEDTARDNKLNEGLLRDANPPEESLTQVTARWIWVRHDFDEDGIAELIHVVMVGDDILDIQPATTIPVASLVPFINTHRHPGMSVADLTLDIQRIKTDFLRQGIDNLRFSNNPREFFSKKVNTKALLLSRPGAKIEVNTQAPDVAGHVHTSSIPFVFPQTQDGLRHMDSVVESRVGVNRIFQGIDESNINDHNRIGQLSTMASQRVEQIARIFGNGVRRLFAIAHELVIKSAQRAEKIRLRGEWVEFDPTQWKTGRDMRVVAPYAAGNKDSLLQRLLVHMNIHREALSAGLPIVQVDDAYELALEIAKATDLPGDRIYTDPATIEPPPPQPDPTLIALDIENKNADTKAREVEVDAEVKLATVRMQEAIEKYKVDVNAEVQLLVAQAKGDGNINLERLRGALRNEPVMLANESISRNADNVNELAGTLTQTQSIIETLAQQVDQLQADLSAPVEVVRGEDGRITGKRIGTDRRFVPLSEAG